MSLPQLSSTQTLSLDSKDEDYDTLLEDSQTLVKEAKEVLRHNSRAMHLHNIDNELGCQPPINNMVAIDYPNQLSDSSSPSSSTNSEIEKLQNVDVQGNILLNTGNNTLGELGDRVMSRRSTQQAQTQDLFAQPPSSFRPETRQFNSTSINTSRCASASIGFDALGLGLANLSHESLHHDMHGTLEAKPSISSMHQSCRIDGTMHNMFSLENNVGHLQISDDIKNIFQYIDAYKPQEVEIGTILKPFIPDYILAVGATDEFIKVPRPDKQPDYLGLKVLDESGAKQSDPAVLTLQLRATSNQPSLHLLEVASIENADKNPKKLDAWINSIKDLHRTKPPSCVNYSKVMPEVEQLLHEWPTEIEKVLAEIQLPAAKLDVDLATFVDICCSILDIPV